MEQRKALEPQLDLASDNIADDDLTVDLSEAGWATYTNDADGNEPISTDDGLPCIPRGRQRLSNIVAPKQRIKQVQQVSHQRFPAMHRPRHEDGWPRRHACPRFRQQFQRNPMKSTFCLPVTQMASWSCRETPTTAFLRASEAPSNVVTLALWWLSMTTTTRQ